MTQPNPASQPDSARPNPFSLANAAIENALLTGAHPDLLAEYFGESAHAELVDLARQAHSRSLRGAGHVLILPGIMGTKLGLPHSGPLGLCDDVIWLDPIDLAEGELIRLGLGDTPNPCVPLGVMLLFYLKLKLRLRAAGFNADFHPYDWRLDIATLGTQLAQRIAALPHGPVHLVAHSMGGLVARAALRQLAQQPAAARVVRLVMLGTPNFGSFLATQAIRGTLDTVRALAFFDPRHHVDELCAQVFNTFPGLYHLLPAAGKFARVDLYDPAQWPAEGPQPNPKLLALARQTQDLLAPPDPRFALIAGVDQKTVTDLEPGPAGFAYTETTAGDGTVPLALAQLPGTSTWFVAESHGSLPNNALVTRAVIDLLNTGTTSALPRQWAPSRAARRTVTDTVLRAAVPDTKRGAPPNARETRTLLDRFLSTTARETSPASTAANPQAVQLDTVRIARRRQHRLDICLAQGSITEVSARAIVLGLFREVAPEGPALALDRRLGGAIAEFTQRRMFAGGIGEVFILPTGRRPVWADLILFTGLGTFDQFNEDVLDLVAENVVRTLVRTDVDDFATVLLGGRSGPSVGSLLESLFRGFLRGLLDADRDRALRRLTLCELDPDRFEEIKRELLRLAATPLFADVEVTFDETRLPVPPETPEPVSRGLAAPAGLTPAYLIVRQEGGRGSLLRFRSAVLTAGAKASVLTAERLVDPADLDRFLRDLTPYHLIDDALPDFAARLANLALAPEVLAVLPALAGQPLAIVHDAAASRLPWELLRCGDSYPALDGGMSRRYLADNLSVAKWLDERRTHPILEMLLVVNPTADLAGAEAEADRILDLLATHPGVRITRRSRDEATRGALLEDFRSGRFDLVHYAGHAFFDARHPSASGLCCAHDEILSGRDLSGLGNLPNLVFFNACESARVRGTTVPRRAPAAAPAAPSTPSGPGTAAEASNPAPTPALDLAERVNQTVGLAEAFLRGGVANYVGTYWPVGDNAAREFAGRFYGAIIEGQSIGSALLAGRAAVRALPEKSVDWADYVHYGNPHFVVKLRSP
jgi:CHAT domain-containing protein